VIFPLVTDVPMPTAPNAENDVTRQLSLYAATTVIFFALDFVWLSLSSGPIYRKELGNLLLDQPNLAVAAGFYLIYVLGLVLIVSAPAEGNIGKALWMGALFGLVAYGTYDLTNLSTVRGFTPTVAAIDMAWGTFVTAVSAAGGVFLVSLLKTGN
jgi:uncharacterized membrane protein